MRTARAILFACVFYLITALFLVFGIWLLLTPRRWAMRGLKLHALICLAAQRLIAGTRYEVRGRENLPHAPYLAVAKHQSAWETFALIPLFQDPAIVMKSELTRIPVYGWFCRKFDHILVKRERRAAALKSLIAEAKKRTQCGREILIFAEGTRTDPGAKPDYKPGFVALYQALDLPMVPIALNSGLYWPRGTSLSYPGTIIVDILPAIEPGLPRAAARAAIIDAVETATAALIDEAEASGEASEAVGHARLRGKLELV